MTDDQKRFSTEIAWTHHNGTHYPTVLAKIANPTPVDGDFITVDVVALLDTGADHSIIMAETAGLLGLTAQGSATAHSVEGMVKLDRVRASIVTYGIDVIIDCTVSIGRSETFFGSITAVLGRDYLRHGDLFLSRLSPSSWTTSLSHLRAKVQP